MKIPLCLLMGLALILSTKVQAQIELDPDVLDAVQGFVQENVDEKALDALGVDKDRALQFFQELDKVLQGDSVYDLANLQETAKAILPVLRNFEETQPYAAWLESHWDYFVVSERLKAQAPKDKPQPSAPPPELQRSVWVAEVRSRPVPTRAAKYLPQLETIFTEEKAPVELLWLAEVESAFDPSAKSPAGAAGMYQLMPKTAKDLKLSLWPRDERFQPEKNARAAARYLRQLHDRFGDWRLALAAYNAGPGRVEALLKKHKAKTYEGIAAHLPVETQLYVPKYEAVLRKRKGMELADLKTPDRG